MATPKTQRQIVGTWALKGQREMNPFSKFICYWIAFNSWLYLEMSGDRDLDDWRLIKKFCQGGEYKNTYAGIVDKYEEIIERLREVCPIKDSRSERFSGHYPEAEVTNIKILKQVIAALYRVRCNLFHAAKWDNNKRDKEVMAAAAPVIELFVNRFCLKQILWEDCTNNYQRIAYSIIKSFNQGRKVSYTEIRDTVLNYFPNDIAEGSILPSDYCSNHKNEDPRSGKYTIFSKCKQEEGYYIVLEHTKIMDSCFGDLYCYMV